MSVVVIGDRSTGKTSMVRALAENGRYVRVDGYDSLVKELYNPVTKHIAGTDTVQERPLVMNIDMPATGVRQIRVLWIDTPGEFWSNSQHRVDHSSAWQALEEKACSSRALILLLPPHQTLVQKERLNNALTHLKPVVDLPNAEQWVNRLEWWLNFFAERCKGVKHILIAIHKADLFCDVKAESKRWEYKPEGGKSAPWFEYSEYVLDTYFSVASKDIRKYKASEIGSRTHFFITTTEDQGLLELPWLFLGPYIAYR
jgi:signal recognition particle receptor subunit beta